MKEADKMLKRSLRQFRRRQKRLLQHVERLERLLAVRPTEIHNHFEAGSSAQVFNGRAAGRFRRRRENHENTKDAAMPACTQGQQPQSPQSQQGPQPQQPTTALLVERVARVREYFWADSAMAVIFCACRDCYGYPDNMSRFEREFGCTEGLLSGTLRNNPYMRLPVGRWQQAGAKPRALRLLEAYRRAVETCGE
ncbi:MAG: hypothetical protein IJ544_04410 [Prevotella sp.]|nr:hypothetical protein [Prevotella sp.]